MEALYPSGKVIPINTEPLVKLNGDYATGLTTIKFKLRRASDDYVLDWAAPGGGREFVDPIGGVNQLLQALVEVDPTTFPGEYHFALDLATVSNALQYDAYFVTIVDDSPTSQAVNGLQVGQFRISPELDDATLARKNLYNDQDLQPGNSDNLELLDDDGTTPLARWDVSDKDGLNIGLGAGVPAKRKRVL